MVSSTPRLHFTPGKDPVPIVQEAGWAPGPVWTGGKSRPHRDSIPDRPAHSSVGIATELPGPHLYNRTEYILSSIWPQNLPNSFEFHIVLGYFEYFKIYLILIRIGFIKEGLLQNKLSVFWETSLCDMKCKSVSIYSFRFHILFYMYI